MDIIRSISDKRIIITARLNGKDANFLVDTGATVGVIDERVRKKYGLVIGKKFPKPLVGAGGEFDAYFCHTPAYIGNIPLSQFLLADIRDVVRAVSSQTGIEIQGVISLPQMQFAGIKIDTRQNTIIID